MLARGRLDVIGLQSKMSVAWAREVSGQGITPRRPCGSSATIRLGMAVIPQDRLCNEIAAVLRRAERGERFTVTVAGRPFAELGPLPGARSLAPPESLAAILAETPPDPGFAEDLRRMRQQDRESARDPWAA
jgi:antitoxin (DNA-binding transcriptional repressor) of toxin-antitoxin stability system